MYDTKICLTHYAPMYKRKSAYVRPISFLCIRENPSMSDDFESDIYKVF